MATRDFYFCDSTSSVSPFTTRKMASAGRKAPAVSIQSSILEKILVGMGSRGVIRYQRGMSVVKQEELIHDLAIEGIHAFFIGRMLVFDIPMLEGGIERALLIILGKVGISYGIDILTKNSTSKKLMDRFVDEGIVQLVHMLADKVISNIKVPPRADSRLDTH